MRHSCRSDWTDEQSRVEALEELVCAPSTFTLCSLVVLVEKREVICSSEKILSPVVLHTSFACKIGIFFLSDRGRRCWHYWGCRTPCLLLLQQLCVCMNCMKRVHYGQSSVWSHPYLNNCQLTIIFNVEASFGYAALALPRRSLAGQRQ